MKRVQVLAAAALICAASPAFTQAPSLPHPGSVFLEELTWFEVRDAIAGGKTTIIIPTGGTEQNGPHIVLGKHNYLVKYKAGEIASAPRERARCACRRVRARRRRRSADRPHAVRRHHHDTAGRVRQGAGVCGAELQAAWVPRHRARRRQRRQSGRAAARRRRTEQGMGATPVRVHHITAFYPGRGDDWVVSQGVSAEDVGTHAGTHDTASLMYINPSMLRFDKMVVGKSGDGQGHVGNPAKATALFGKRILEMQIEDATRRFGSFRVSSRRCADLADSC